MAKGLFRRQQRTYKSRGLRPGGTQIPTQRFGRLKLVLSFRLIVEGRMALIYLFWTTIWIHLRVKFVSRVSMIISVDVCIHIVERKFYESSKVHIEICMMCYKKRNKVQDVSMLGAGAKSTPRNSRTSPKGSRNQSFHMSTWMSLTSPYMYTRPPSNQNVTCNISPNLMRTL